MTEHDDDPARRGTGEEDDLDRRDLDRTVWRISDRDWQVSSLIKGVVLLLVAGAFAALGLAWRPVFLFAIIIAIALLQLASSWRTAGPGRGQDRLPSRRRPNNG